MHRRVGTVVAIGMLFGSLGLLLGYPLAIVMDVAVRRLYVRDALSEDVESPARTRRRAPAPTSRCT